VVWHKEKKITMGHSGFSSMDFDAGVRGLASSGSTFSRSATAVSTGVRNIADILDPRKLKNGMRESCFAPGFNDATPIIVALDGTGSMEHVPHDMQKQLPKLIDMITEKGISDHPNVMFMMFGDERATPPDAAFQMSQFEIGSKELLTALNEMIIPGNGGGNNGEAYHLAFYAAANHTRIESFERDGAKGYFFLIEDEQPFYDSGDPAVHGTTPALAKEVFGDRIQSEIPMLESVRKTCERYHVFVIRPGHTNHGTNKSIKKMWQKLLSDAGENPEYVLEVPETSDIVPTMAAAIGRLAGETEDDLADVLKSKGIRGVSAALIATQALVPVARGAIVAGKVSGGALATSSGSRKGRKRTTH